MFIEVTKRAGDTEVTKRYETDQNWSISATLDLIEALSKRDEVAK